MSRGCKERPVTDGPFSWRLMLGSFALVGLAAVRGPGAPQRLAVIDGLSGAEAVTYDTAQGVYFVSDVNGAVGVKDGNGFISRIPLGWAPRLAALHSGRPKRDRAQWPDGIAYPGRYAAVTGTAELDSVGPARSTARISIRGDRPGAIRPWHLHHGQCGQDGAVLGSASDYPPIKVGPDGTGSATASLEVPTPATGDYLVNVHASAVDLTTIVACGDLHTSEK